MSRGSEVHIFWGAPVGPLKMTRSQEPTSLMSTANPWEKIQLLYNQHSFSLKDEDCEDENLEEYQVLEAPGPPDLLSGHVLANTVSRSVHGKDGVAHCISETQTVKSQKRHPLGMRDVTQSHVQTCGCACRVQRLPEEEKYQKLSNENKKVTVEPHEDQSNICDQNAQNSSFQLDLVWSTEQIPTAPDTVEPKCVPTGPCKAQNLRLEKTSSNTGHKPESEGAVRKVSDLKVSADTEFLSVMTSSQFAFLVQMKSKGEKSVSKGTGNIEIEPEACHGEIKTTEDNLIQPDDAFVERYESRRNQAYSLELFSPVFSETKSSCIHITSDEGLKENRGSQGLCRSEAKLLSTEVCVESHGSGILCSQLSAIKRNRTSEDKLDRLQVRQVSKKTKLASNAGDLPAARDPRSVSGFKGIKKTSLIKNCDSKSQKYNCLVMVLSPCHVKEIRIKSGPNSGSQVPLATVVVTDQSEMKKKVFLWRTAAFWALTVSLGDIILLTDVTVRDAAWDGEVILQSTFTSQLLNLGSHASVRPEEHSGIVSDIVLRDLLAYVSSKHSYLRDLPQRQPQKMNNIEFVELEKLQPDILVHAVLRVIDITVLTEALYSYRGQQQKKIMLTVEQDQGQHSVLILWGRAAAWYPQLQRKKGYIWEFKYLFVQRNCILENLELHTTPWSSCECLFDDDIRAITFKAKFQKSKLSFMKMSDLATHLEDKCSGVVLIKAWVSELAFPVPAAQKVVMNAHSSLRSIFSSLPSVTYTGCAQCGSELETDENKIYRPCVRCLPSTRKAAYYRPALMTIVDGLYKVSVHVGSKLMEKVLLNISPAWLNRVVAPPSAVTYGLVAADALHSLLAGGACLAKVQSRFVLDENSYPLQQQFSLLDLSPPVDSGELASCALP